MKVDRGIKPLKNYRRVRSKSLVTAANSLSNPLLQFCPHYQVLTLSNPSDESSSARLSCQKSDNLSNDAKKEIMNLMAHNMRSLYEKSTWGWKENEKRTEIFSDKSWILTCYVKSSKSSSEMAAFVHFRYEIEEDRAVLYVYEIQVHESYQGQGIGRTLLNLLYDLAKKTSMSRLLLTTFEFNTKARTFFEKNGFVIDQTDPSNFKEKRDYLVLSRSILNDNEIA